LRADNVAARTSNQSGELEEITTRVPDARSTPGNLPRRSEQLDSIDARQPILPRSKNLRVRHPDAAGQLRSAEAALPKRRGLILNFWNARFKHG